jgi:hypothetical protein
VGISRFRDLLQANQCKNWAAGWTDMIPFPVGWRLFSLPLWANRLSGT